MQSLLKFSRMVLNRAVITTELSICGKGLFKLFKRHLSTIHNNIEGKNPYNVELSAGYKKSFAYYSIRKADPYKIQKIIDRLQNNRGAITHKYGNKANEELSEIIKYLNMLKCDILTDNEFRMFDIWSPDTDLWNASLCEIGNRNTFFSSVWLFAQCYMYRRIREIFLEQPILKCFDYFRAQKKNALTTQFTPMCMIAQHIEMEQNLLQRNPEKLQKHFENFIKLDLWGNLFDLSISDKQIQAPQNPLAVIVRYDASILVNNITNIWQCLSEPSLDHRTAIVDFVCDNAGYELFIDLCIGDFLLTNCLAKCVRFHVKMIPFFVSDVMPTDFLWTIQMLRNHTDSHLSKLGQRFSDYLQDGRFKLMDNEYFWTTGYGYNRMKEIDDSLYQTLGDARLIIFKGDLNYRKLMGEVNWKPSTPFADALQGFCPSNLCSLRTVKSQLISGLKQGVAQQLERHKPKWMITGEYGVVQFVKKE